MNKYVETGFSYPLKGQGLKVSSMVVVRNKIRDRPTCIVSCLPLAFEIFPSFAPFPSCFLGEERKVRRKGREHARCVL